MGRDSDTASTWERRARVRSSERLRVRGAKGGKQRTRFQSQMISDVHSTSSPRADDSMDPGLRSRQWDSALKTRREVRRERKQKAERSRRNRLNESFSELQNLVLRKDNQDGSSGEVTTVQKATILEATVRYIKKMQRTQGGAHGTADGEVPLHYQQGFSTAIDRIENYLAREHGMSDMLKVVLSQHLQKMRRDMCSSHATPPRSTSSSSPALESPFAATSGLAASRIGAEQASSTPHQHPPEQQPGYPWYPCAEGLYTAAQGSFLGASVSPIHPYVCPSGSPQFVGGGWTAPGRVSASANVLSQKNVGEHPSTLSGFTSPSSWSNVVAPVSQLQQYSSTPQTPTSVMYPVSVDTRLGSFQPQDSGYCSPSVAMSPFYGVDAGASLPLARSPCGGVAGVLNLSKRRRVDDPVPTTSGTFPPASAAVGGSDAAGSHPAVPTSNVSSGLAPLDQPSSSSSLSSSSSAPVSENCCDDGGSSETIDVCSGPVSPEDVEIAQIMARVGGQRPGSLPCSLFASSSFLPSAASAWWAPPGPSAKPAADAAADVSAAKGLVATTTSTAAAPASSSAPVSLSAPALDTVSDPHKMAACSSAWRPW